MYTTAITGLLRLADPDRVPRDMLLAGLLIQWDADGQESVCREFRADGCVGAVVCVEF
jgi:hypothetical protein